MDITAVALAVHSRLVLEIVRLPALVTNSYWSLVLTILLAPTAAGIIASFTFVAADKPRYTRGYSLLLAFMLFTAVMTITYWLVLTRDNRKKDKGSNKYVTDPAAWDSLSNGEKAKLGDLGPSYRYLR